MRKQVKKYEIVMCKGLPASGKSTWAKQEALKPFVKRINKDELRAMLDNSKHTKTNEKYVCYIRNMILLDCLLKEYSVIIDDTNFHPSHKNTIIEYINSYNSTSEKIKYTFREEFFDVDVMECIRRNVQRSGNARVPHSAIFSMYNEFLRSPDQPILTVKDIPTGLIYDRNLGMNAVQDDRLPKAIICDLDGTLSILAGRSPYATSGCINDKLNIPVANILKTYFKKGYKIILFSGRNGEQYVETLKWLEMHDIPFDKFRIRNIGDTRADKIIKREMYDESVKDKFYVEFVLDDRDQVVDLWRKDLGLPCLQVNYGNF